MKSLLDVMRTLRGPAGCPWDKKQTNESLLACLIEEVHEVVDAVLLDDAEKTEEELGDLMCIVSMMMVIAEEKNAFTKQSVIKSAVSKMKRRHPHVFSTKTARTFESAHDLWHKEKNKEKSVQKRESLLDEVSVSAPALLRADKMQRRVARVGFDWPTIDGAIDKVEEELHELKEEIHRSKRMNRQRVKEELGDLLFSVVNIGRKLKINAEVALAKTNTKFMKRFQRIERELKKQGKSCAESSLEEMDALWEKAKKAIRRKKH